MPTNWTIWAKWINSQKQTIFQLNQEESENLNRQITTNETEAVIKKVLNKSPVPDGFFYQIFNIYQQKTIPKNSGGGKTPKPTLQSQPNPHAKTR